jgi:hypothetical protein
MVAPNAPDAADKSTTPRKRPAKKKAASKRVMTPRQHADDSRGKPWTFPKHKLEEAILVAKAIEDKNGGNPMRAEMIAKAVGFNQPNDWRFQDMLKAARMYGLVSGSGVTATVGLEKIGQDIVAPSSSEQRRQALREAFHNVDEFKRVDDFYRGKRIPEDEYFLNTLTRDFGIQRSR